jgi:nicotinamidase-related amidase
LHCGCDDQPQCKNYQAWSRQHPALRIADEDGISDNGEEVYSELQRRGIKNLVVMGVHTNMCVLRRTFAIRQMTQWGMRCVLARDLTDTMYNPRMSPQVSHDKGTELVVEYIEKYWCPTILSADLLRK